MQKILLAINKKLLCKYLASFILILLIPTFIFLMFFYNYFYLNTTYYNNKQQMDMAENGKTILTNVFDQINGINILISKHKEFAPARIEADFYNVSRARDILNEYIYMNNMIIDCFLIIPDFDYAVSSRSSYPINIFKKTINNAELDKCSSFSEVAKLERYFKANFSADYTQSLTYKESICYLMPVTHISDYYGGLYVMYVLDANKLATLVNSAMYAPEYTEYCLAYKDEILLSSFEEAPNIQTSQLENNTTYKDGEKQYYISLVNSQQGKIPLDIVYFTHYDTYIEPIKKILTDMGIALSCIMGIGFVVILVLSVYSYQPIRTIRKLLILGNQGEGVAVDDYSYIINNLNKLIDEHSTMRELDIVNRRQLKNYCIFKILNSSDIDEITTLQVLKRLNIFFNEKSYMCCFIKLNQVFEEVRIVNAIEILKKDELIQPHFESCYVINKKDINIIFNFPGESSEEIIEKIKGFCNMFIREYDAVIGVGGVVQGFNKIQESFKEATIAMQYATASKNQGFMRYDRAMIIKKTGILCNNSYLNRLVSCAKQEDKEGIEKILKEIEEYIITNEIPIYLIKSTYYHVINTLLMTLDEGNKYKMSELLMELDSLFNSNSLNDLNKKILESCNLKREKIQGGKFVEEIIEYIQENCLSYDFSISNMAEEFNISHQQMSNLFKKEVGTTLMEYINRFRMNTATNLLISTELPIATIVAEVGYIDNSSFTRKFKKIMGVTPAEYRNLYALQER